MNLILILILWFTHSEETPPGTKKVGDLFVDKTEILNIHWMEYLHYQKMELDSNAFKALLPDKSNSWYYLYEARLQPIVLITHQQALDYCKWRSKFVSAKMQKKVTYRLPSPAEWTTVAKANISDSVSYVKKELTQREKLNPDALHLFDIKENEDKFYHLFDNVSEMTQEEGLAMGSNNHDIIKENKKLNPILYKKPNPYLGFRCVAEIDE